MDFIEYTYRTPMAEGACAVDAVGGHKFHERCYCESVALSDCKNMCSNDLFCKGYVKTKGRTDCQIATTSSCQPGCKKANIGNNGNLILDSNFRSATYEGCFIKGTS